MFRPCVDLHDGKVKAVVIVVLVATVFSGCCFDDARARRERITFHDRNGDGKVDLEKHTFPGVTDSNWELRDDDYDGRFERKLRQGFGVLEAVVDLPVPVGVKIEVKP